MTGTSLHEKPGEHGGGDIVNMDELAWEALPKGKARWTTDQSVADHGANDTGGAPGVTGGMSGTFGGTGGSPSTGGVSSGGSPPEISGPTTPVSGGDAIPSALSQALTDAAAQTGASLRESHPVELGKSLGYDASKATGLSLIQASPLALTAAQLAKLSENGLVIAKERTFPSFIYGYKSIYAADLPVYVSADSILYAVHHSFDKVLEMVEEG